MHPRHLYVHVPFCARKCGYCAFFSQSFSPRLADRYVRALGIELGMLGDRLDLETLFFGGGTPTLLTTAQWLSIARALETRFAHPPGEWTVECNPATVSLDKARLLRSLGVNRISLGVQSFDERLLERLGRIHSRDDALRSFDILRRAGFENINLDLMFGIPGQDLADWCATLDEAFALGSEHLSCYEVIYEEDTPLFDQLRAGRFEPDEELACRMYELLQDRTAAAGYRQYEVANFARRDTVDRDCPPRLACRHNINCWQGGTFEALGPSACRHIGGIRSRNVANTVIYCEQLEQGKRPVESTDPLSPRARAAEIAAFGLRMPAGWDFSEFQSVTGFDLREQWSDAIRQIVDLGWAVLDDTGLRMTPAGLRFADAAAMRFLDI